MILCYYIFREKNYENQESVVFCSVLYINLHLLSTGDTRRQLNQITNKDGVKLWQMQMVLYQPRREIFS